MSKVIRLKDSDIKLLERIKNTYNRLSTFKVDFSDSQWISEALKRYADIIEMELERGKI